MRKLTMVAAGLLCIAACARQPAQPPTAAPATVPPSHEDFRTFCSHADCQRDVDIDLATSDGKLYHRHFALLPPSVQPDLVTIYPGQKVQAAAVFRDGKFGGWVEAGAAKPGDVLLAFELQQGPAGMVLSIHNGSQKTVKLALAKVDLRASGDDPQHTSSCPVLAGGADSETWPEPIFEIDVQSADLSPAAAGTCD